MCSWAQEGEKGNLTIITVVVVFIDAVTVGSIELLLRRSSNTLHRGPCHNFTYNGRAHPASFTHLVANYHGRYAQNCSTTLSKRGGETAGVHVKRASMGVVINVLQPVYLLLITRFLESASCVFERLCREVCTVAVGIGKCCQESAAVCF